MTRTTCTDCDGTGYIQAMTCLNCDGRGTLMRYGFGTAEVGLIEDPGGAVALRLITHMMDARFWVSLEQLEHLQGQIQRALGGPSLLNPWPKCKTCGGALAQAKRMAPDRTFWVHEISDMDTHAPEPV